MKVAIIGGGASGLITAYLLRNQHQTVVFEKAPILGGNIRTINGNVREPQLTGEPVTENGVLGFDLRSYPTFFKLAADLDVQLLRYPLHSGLFMGDGTYYLGPSTHQRRLDNFRERARNWLRLAKLAAPKASLERKLASIPRDVLKNRPTSDFIPADNDICNQVMLASFMLAYSIPYDQVQRMPAEITIGALLAQGKTNWHCMPEGVYSYVEKMLQRMPSGHRVHCSTGIQSVSRSESGVLVQPESGPAELFDKVVFATTPDQVLALLTDATEAEMRRFSGWKPNSIKTVAHKDPALYNKYKTKTYSPCDYFASPNQNSFGYNTYINHGYNLERSAPYSFAYNLEEQIDPNKIIHTAHHVTPLYTVDAIRYRDEIAATNGENHTFHAGAYLGNPLHEGAATSANAVAKLLGGQML